MVQEEKMLELLEKVCADQGEMRTMQEKILAEQEKMLAEQEKILAEQEKMRSEQGKMLAEQEKILAEQEKMRSEQGKMLAEQEKMFAEQEKMFAEQEKTNQRLDNLEGQVQFISANVARIENEQDKQFKAIHDKLSLNDDFAEGYAPRMIKLEHRVNNLEVDVVHLKTARAK